jgi:hypothetical protein
MHVLPHTRPLVSPPPPHAPSALPARRPSVRNIHIGPKLPAFVTPNVLGVLVEKFALTPIGDVETDLKKLLKH